MNKNDYIKKLIIKNQQELDQAGACIRDIFYENKQLTIDVMDNIFSELEWMEETQKDDDYDDLIAFVVMKLALIGYSTILPMIHDKRKDKDEN